MRTNIDIDDALMEQTLKATGLPTKRAAVEAGLRLLLRRHERQAILGLAGQVEWAGDLNQSRSARGFAETQEPFAADP